MTQQLYKNTTAYPLTGRNFATLRVVLCRAEAYTIGHSGGRYTHEYLEHIGD